uniref:Uncharacterized protein n=1 Tax=Pectobacterium carotovorum TaxID=554 RepID=A0A0K0MNN4_PECCA|nr:hypothetical protein pA_00086 [Pectobacterium carotovorum]
MLSLLILFFTYVSIACYTTLIAVDSNLRGTYRRVLVGVLWPIWFVIVYYRYSDKKGKHDE